MNKYAPHVYVIPEDDADRQIADGFVLHPRVKDARIQVVPPAGGWSKVLKTFRDEYIPKLRNYPDTHVVMLIDFDDQVEKRKADFEQEIPADVQDARVCDWFEVTHPRRSRKKRRKASSKSENLWLMIATQALRHFGVTNNSAITTRIGNV